MSAASRNWRCHLKRFSPLAHFFFLKINRFQRQNESSKYNLLFGFQNLILTILRKVLFMNQFLCFNGYAMIYHNSLTTKPTFELNVTSSKKSFESQIAVASKKCIYRFTTTVQHCRLVCVHYNFFGSFFCKISVRSYW